MLLGPSSPAALNRWKGWQSLLKNDLGVCKALKTGWEKWNSCVCMQHTHALAHLPSPHLPESRQGGLQDHIVTFLSDLLPDHLSKKRVKKVLCWITWKTTKREEEKSFSSDSKLSHLWVLKYCADALLLTSTWQEKKKNQQSYILGTI